MAWIGLRWGWGVRGRTRDAWVDDYLGVDMNFETLLATMKDAFGADQVPETAIEDAEGVSVRFAASAGPDLSGDGFDFI